MRTFDNVQDLLQKLASEGKIRRDEVKLVGGSDERF
jgi:hypothetical protein